MAEFLLKLIVTYVVVSKVTNGNNMVPQFTEPIPNVRVVVGQDASLPCKVKNLGSHKVAWIHIDKQMILTIQKYVIKRMDRLKVTTTVDGTWFLHVKHVRQEDRGYYMCQINTNPVISQVGYLQVVVAPYFVDDESIVSSSRVNTREGSSPTLKCKGAGYPEPDVIWKREDGAEILVDSKTKGTVIVGEKLQFRQISRASTGVYFCTAVNGVPPSVSRKVFVNVQFPPMITVPKKYANVRMGSEAILRCHVEANPSGNSFWLLKTARKKPSEKIIGSNFKYKVEIVKNSHHTSMKLTIKSVTKSDFNIYGCVSENILGKAEGIISLHELIELSTTIQPTVSSYETQNITDTNDYNNSYINNIEYKTVPNLTTVATDVLNFESTDNDKWIKTESSIGSIISCRIPVDILLVAIGRVYFHIIFT